MSGSDFGGIQLHCFVKNPFTITGSCTRVHWKDSLCTYEVVSGSSCYRTEVVWKQIVVHLLCHTKKDTLTGRPVTLSDIPAVHINTVDLTIVYLSGNEPRAVVVGDLSSEEGVPTTRRNDCITSS